MVRMIVCMKQVPMASELPWDTKSGTLKRELSDGMMNPACKHALEAALKIREKHGGHITAITMGPPMAEEILHEAIAMGVDRCLLISDRRMAGSDTFVTSYALARAIEIFCPDFDLIFTGCYTTDSETGQVGPQLAEELKIPGIANVTTLELKDSTLRIQREADNFLETLEMDLPGLITISTLSHVPRYTALAGLQDAFDEPNILTVGARDLGIDEEFLGSNGSPTQIIDVFTPRSEKTNVVLKGAPKRIVERLFDQFEDMIASAIRKDLKKEA